MFSILDTTCLDQINCNERQKTSELTNGTGCENFNEQIQRKT